MNEILERQGISFTDKELKVLDERRIKADLALRYYPDQEAVRASNTVNDIIKEVENNPDYPWLIDRDSLIYWLSLAGENDDPKMKKGEEEFNKIRNLVSESTGVTVERITAVDKYWSDIY